MGETSARRRNEESSMPACAQFCPKHLRESQRSIITGVDFDSTGREVLATYSGESIYSFDLFHTKPCEDALPPSLRFSRIEAIVRQMLSSGESVGEGDSYEAEASTSGDESSDTFLVRYSGHTNYQTVKDVYYVGLRSEFVASGSDNGRVYIWDRVTGLLVNSVRADTHIVNCVAQSPVCAELAVSGIDTTVKILRPTGDFPFNHSRQIDFRTEQDLEDDGFYMFGLGDDDDDDDDEDSEDGGSLLDLEYDGGWYDEGNPYYDSDSDDAGLGGDDQPAANRRAQLVHILQWIVREADSESDDAHVEQRGSRGSGHDGSRSNDSDADGDVD